MVVGSIIRISLYTPKHAWWVIILLLCTRWKLGPRKCAEAPAVQHARRSQLRGGLPMNGEQLAKYSSRNSCEMCMFV